MRKVAECLGSLFALGVYVVGVVMLTPSPMSTAKTYMRPIGSRNRNEAAAMYADAGVADRARKSWESRQAEKGDIRGWYIADYDGITGLRPGRGGLSLQHAWTTYHVAYKNGNEKVRIVSRLSPKG